MQLNNDLIIVELVQVYYNIMYTLRIDLQNCIERCARKSCQCLRLCYECNERLLREHGDRQCLVVNYMLRSPY